MYLIYNFTSEDTGEIAEDRNVKVLTAMVVPAVQWPAFKQIANQIQRNTENNTFEESVASTVSFLRESRDVRLVNVAAKVGKRRNDEIELKLWKTAIQRVENTLSYENFPGRISPTSYGIIASTERTYPMAQRVLSEMRENNTIPNSREFYSDGSRQMNIERIIDTVLEPEDSTAGLAFIGKMVSSFVGKYIVESSEDELEALSPSLLTVANRNNKFGIVTI